jgi:hypothetical protein
MGCDRPQQPIIENPPHTVTSVVARCGRIALMPWTADKGFVGLQRGGQVFADWSPITHSSGIMSLTYARAIRRNVKSTNAFQ